MDGAKLMRSVTAAFGKSDLQPLLSALHDDIVWKTASKQEEVFRFGGEYKGRAGVVDVLSKISMDYTFRRLAPREILASGDIVWGLFDATLSFDPKGKSVPSNSVELEMAIRWRLKDGKIIEHQAFFDTAALLIQQGRLSKVAANPTQRL
jgi:ketosteroid isomerase-like protein